MGGVKNVSRAEEIKNAEEEEPQSHNICFSVEDMNIAEEHDLNHSQFKIQNYRFFQKKIIDGNNVLSPRNIDIEIHHGNDQINNENLNVENKGEMNNIVIS